ncbi:MAG: hypothetical protein ACYDCS_14355 [Candidatus Dormibacteria bacterium]
MTDWIEPQLSASLDAWRLSSRRAPRRHARERAYDAMLDAIIVVSRRPRTRSFFSFRPRFGHAGLIASTATIVAAASVAAAGWNAPPGSALFVVRAARQGVMLKLPGSDDAALHLDFAEQSLMDAKNQVNPAQSLADAATELSAAFTELSADPTSPLWPRYRLDEKIFVSESEIESENPSPLPAGASPRPTQDDTPSGSRPAQGDGEGTPAARTGSASPSPTGGDGGGGDDGGGSGPSQSPGQSPPPDN